LASRREQAELVEIVDTRVLPDTVELLDKLCRENFAEWTGQSLPPRQRIHDLHLRVPGFNAVSQINRQYSHVDGLDDVLVEIFQTLVLRHLLFERGVEPSVLNRDAYIAGECLEQFHIFTGKEVTLYGLAQTEERDGLLLRSARDVVIQFELCDRRLCARSLARD